MKFRTPSVIFPSLIASLVCVMVLLALFAPPLSSQTTVNNNAANLAGKTLLAAENSNTVSGLLSFSRGSNAPFAVNVGAAKVANLNADTVDGVDSLTLLGVTGQVSFFNLSSCPSGWTEYTPLRGRMPVGMPAGGTLAGSVGTALTDLQDKTHTHTGPNHQHTYTDVVNHVHVINITDPGHFHVYSGTAWTVAGTAGATEAGNFSSPAANTTTVTTGVTAVSVNPAGGVATGTTALGGTGATGTTALSTFLSYHQLLACVKS